VICYIIQLLQVSAAILNALNHNLLSVLNKEWTDHQVAMAMIRDILMYLDKIYVEPSDLDNFFNLGIILFRDKVLIMHFLIKRFIK
jgi:cullin 3